VLGVTAVPLRETVCRLAERSVARVQQARKELRNVIGFSVADEIEKLDRLKHSEPITEDEFTHLRAKLVKAA
jgi:hypothetical protein